MLLIKVDLTVYGVFCGSLTVIGWRLWNPVSPLATARVTGTRTVALLPRVGELYAPNSGTIHKIINNINIFHSKHEIIYETTKYLLYT